MAKKKTPSRLARVLDSLSVIWIIPLSGLVIVFLPVLLVLKPVYTAWIRKKFLGKMASLTGAAGEGISPVDEDRTLVFRTAEQGDEPQAPLILIGRRGDVDVTMETAAGAKQGNRLGVLNLSGYFHYYAADGRVWTQTITCREPRVRWLAALLAETIYNPRVEYHSSWHFERSYPFSELREAICLCIEIDDETLTQWIEPDTLTRRIRDADSFDQVLAVLKRTGAMSTRIRGTTRKKKHMK